MFVEKDITLKTSKRTGSQILGDISLESIVDGLIEGGVDELSGAIYEEMETIKGKSQDIVPHRFGVLEGSADAVGVNVTRSGSKGAITIGYGGAASAYSLIQHETPPPGEAGEGELAFRHAPGRTWKYLERPVNEAIEGMEGRIAERVRKRLAAR